MATRSTIAMEYQDGTVKQVYCHWDGYLEHNGRLLQEYWNDSSKLAELIELGDLSSLSQAIGEQHDFNSQAEGQCTFYGRDRGESDTGARLFKSLEEYQQHCQLEEFNYLRTAEGQWQYSTNGKRWCNLADNLVASDEG